MSGKGGAVMEKAYESLRKLLNNCEVCLGEEVISKELLLDNYYSYLCEASFRDNHNVGIVLHTGSICFDALSLAFAAVYALSYNTATVEDIVDYLEIDDKVYFYETANSKGTLYRFDGKDEEGYIKLSGGKNNTFKVPKQLWGNIEPYFGEAVTLDRKKANGNNLRMDFCVEALGMNPSEITRMVDVSVAFVMNKTYADNLIKNIAFNFNGKTIKLTELVPTTYYSESLAESPYGDNSGRIEAVIKVTSKLSVARQLILNSDYATTAGLFILGESSLKKSQSEVYEMIDRRSLKFVYLCTDIYSSYIPPVIETITDAKIYACTKEYLLQSTIPTEGENYFAKELAARVDAIIEKQITTITVPNYFDKNTYETLLKALRRIKLSDYSSENKDSFVKLAYSVFNILLTAVFPLSMVGDVNTVNNTEIKDIESRMLELFELSTSLPLDLRESSNIVASLLSTLTEAHSNNNQKEEELLKILEANKGRQIAIVVPKQYYVPIIEKTVDSIDVMVTTINKFDNTIIYDLIIVVGAIEGASFSIFRNASSQREIVLLYEGERLRYDTKENNHKKIESYLNKHSFYPLQLDDNESDDDNEVLDGETEGTDIQQIDNDISSFVNDNWFSISFKHGENSKQSAPLADVIAIAKFTSGEKCYFSKNYKAYVLDEVGKNVVETDAKKLSEGDTLLFTRSNARTRDIVDEMLNRIMEDETNIDREEIREAYTMSKLWRKALLEYMKDNDLTAGAVAKALQRKGSKLNEITIRVWLDDNARIVGPREKESIKQIAILTNDIFLMDNVDAVFRSCAKIRKLRMRILKELGNAVISSVSGRTSGFWTEVVKDVIDEMALTRQIEEIKQVSEKVPGNYVNQPLED